MSATEKQWWRDNLYGATARRTQRSLVKAFRPDAKDASLEHKRLASGEVDFPNLTYPHLIKSDYSDSIQELTELLPTWLENTPLRRIYKRLLTERLLVNLLADAAKRGDMAAFRDFNRQLGYVPSGRFYLSICAHIRQRAEVALEYEASRPAATALLEVLYPADPSQILLPDSSQVAACFPAMLDLCDQLELPTDVDFDAVWDAEELARVLRDSLLAVGVDDWTVEVTDQQQRISIDRPKKLAKIPSTRKLQGRDAYALIAHERLHIERALRGADSRYYFLYSGTAGYITGEEGTTLALEQALKGRADRHAREDYYLAIGLASGLDVLPRSFKNVYEVMCAYYAFVDVEPDQEADATESPEERAWQQTLRTFRGTDCKGDGVFYGKDVVYAEGNLGIWQLLIEQPEQAQTFMIGKFNPMNPDDVRDLTELGLLAA